MNRYLAGFLCLFAAAHAAEIRYDLDRDSQVTLVVEDATGQRVRNLIAQTARTAGSQVETWDGRDDAGRPLPAGEYRWRGLAHEGIRSHFTGAIYSPGNPPWVTSEVPAQWHVRASGRGGWLADHSAPVSVAVDGERIFVGAPVAEAGHSLIELDANGRKVWGTLWLGQAGANALAVADEILYVAAEGGWLGKNFAIHRLDLKTRRPLPRPAVAGVPRSDISFVKAPQSQFAGIRGLAVTANHLVVALADHGRLALFDRETGDLVRSISLPQPGGVVAVDVNTVLAIASNQVVRLDLTSGGAEVVIGSELAAPVGLARDAAGRLYVTDADQCVKVFSPTGKLVSRIGQPGGRREGRFEPLAMGQPTGVAVDARGQVWVAEHDQLPKRVSVWSADGRLMRDFLGPPFYGGGAALDPRVPGRAYFRGMIFDWAPWPHGNTLRSVSLRPELHSDLPFPLRPARLPQYPVYRGDRLYLVQDGGWTSGGVFIGEVRDEVLRPVVILSSLRTLRERWPEFRLDSKADGSFLWQDANRDGRASTNEVTLLPGWSIRAEWSLRAWPTLTLSARSAAGLHLLEPRADTEALEYDVRSAQTVPLPDVKSICALIVAPGGDVLISEGGQSVRRDLTNRLLALGRDGRIRWSYPNPYPSNSHASPRPTPGALLHTLGFEGFAQAGEIIFQLGGNKGSRYLFTADGLFVAETFRDIRVAPGLHAVATVERGDPLQDYNLGDEVFGGWLGNGPDGKVYQILGKEHCSIFEVRGLETIRRLPGGAVTLTTAPATQEVATAVGPAPIDVLWGNVSRHWTKQAYRLPPGEPQARFLLAADPRELQLVIQVEDPSPFQNHGDDPAELCRTGDAVDLRLTTPQGGDQRFVIAPQGERVVVVRYRYTVPGTTQPREFVSPTGRVTVDAIDVLALDQYRAKLERTATGYELQIRIRWAAFGLSERPTGVLHGDVGVIFSDPTGRRAVAREYYFDPGSREVSDLPSEIRVNSAVWGPWRF